MFTLDHRAIAYLESAAVGLVGAVGTAALQSLQAQDFGHINWSVVGAVAATAAMSYALTALRWLQVPPALPPQTLQLTTTAGNPETATATASNTPPTERAAIIPTVPPTMPQTVVARDQGTTNISAPLPTIRP